MHYAGFMRRAAAALIDYLVIGAAAFVVTVALMVIADVGELARMKLVLSEGERPVHVAFLATLAIAFLYETLMIGSAAGATIGKRLLGVRISRPDGASVGVPRAAGRHLAKYLSLHLLGLGFLHALWEPRKRTLHDRLAGTVALASGDAPARRGMLVIGASPPPRPAPPATLWQPPLARPPALSPDVVRKRTGPLRGPVSRRG